MMGAYDINNVVLGVGGAFGLSKFTLWYGRIIQRGDNKGSSRLKAVIMPMDYPVILEALVKNDDKPIKLFCKLHGYNFVGVTTGAKNRLRKYAENRK